MRMGERKLLTKKDIKYLKKHTEFIPLILGISFIILGTAEIGMGTGLLYWIIGKKIIIKRRMNQIDSIDPWEFEKLIADNLVSVGFKAYATSGSGDKGIDVIAEKGSYKIVIQVKKYSGSVGFDAIKEAHTGLSLYQANEAWVITSSNRFTKQAIETAEKLKIRLFTWGDFGLFLERQENKKLQ